jgi:hypothetical protein
MYRILEREGQVRSRSAHGQDLTVGRSHDEPAHALDHDTATGFGRQIADSGEALDVRQEVDVHVELCPHFYAGTSGVIDVRLDVTTRWWLVQVGMGQTGSSGTTLGTPELEQSILGE